jgi:hypothetical protein
MNEIPLPDETVDGLDPLEEVAHALDYWTEMPLSHRAELVAERRALEEDGDTDD